MPSLADIQDQLATAIVGGSLVGETLFTCTGDARARVAIHQRNYRSSLVEALCTKFPATSWLAGEDFVASAASAYAMTKPPAGPCIARYGDDFPAYISRFGQAYRCPYLRAFAELEWIVGQASIEITKPAVLWPQVATLGPTELLGTSFSVQAGVHYVHSRWDIDRLFAAYLQDQASETFVLAECETYIEVRGARGAVELSRLDLPTFVFRSAISEGRSVATAAEEALDRSESFDPGRALQQLVDAGLLTTIIPAQGETS